MESFEVAPYTRFLVHWLYPFDFESDKINELSNFLITRVHKVPGVKGTETLPSAEE